MIGIETIKNNLFGIGDSHQSLQVFKRLVVVNLLGIGVLDAIALIGCLLFIQNLKLDLSAQLCGRRFWDNPRRVELLDMLQTWDDRGLQARRCHHHKIVGKGWIVWLILGKVEVKVDERCHQISLASSHRQTKEVVGIGDSVEYLLKRCFIVYLVGMLLDILLQLRSQLFAFLIV